jgi:hypothetical protein
MNTPLNFGVVADDYLRDRLQLVASNAKQSRITQNGPAGLKSCGLWQMNPTFLCSGKELRLGINGANRVLVLNRT